MYIDSLFSFPQKLCTYAWDFNLNTNPSWFCAAHGLTLGSIATPVISDFGFPKAVHLHWESPLSVPANMLLNLCVEFANGEGLPVSSLKSELRFPTPNKYILLNICF
jgi:hypothetical protein